MRRIKKTKIIATLGPSTSSKDSIEMLIKEGADVLRINFSHSTHKEASSLIKAIRSVNEKLNTNTSILVDLQGPNLGLVKLKLIHVLMMEIILRLVQEKNLLEIEIRFMLIIKTYQVMLMLVKKY